MPSTFTIFRYVVYAVFVICNAVIASVAVWGLSLANVIKISAPATPYLIFVGCFGLLFSFVIIFIELLYRQAITCKVWFECSWIGFFLFLELIAASLATNDSLTLCSANGAVAIKASCSLVTNILQAFTWLCTAILLIYFFVLIITAGVQHFQNGPGVWISHVRNFPIPQANLTPNPPPAPREQFVSPSALSVVAPKPRNAAKSNFLYSHSGLSQYEIEHYDHPHPPPPLPQNHQQNYQVSSATSLYPTFLQSSLVAQPAPVLRAQEAAQSRKTPTPPPLGNWPRADIISCPPVPKNRTASRRDLSPEPLSPSRSRPAGPRKRSGSGSRPADHLMLAY